MCHLFFLSNGGKLKKWKLIFIFLTITIFCYGTNNLFKLVLICVSTRYVMLPIGHIKNPAIKNKY